MSAQRAVQNRGGLPLYERQTMDESLLVSAGLFVLRVFGRAAFLTALIGVMAVVLQWYGSQA